MKREEFDVLENEIGDYTDVNFTWCVNGEEYTYEDEDAHSSNGDGYVTTVVVKRRSDGKYFQFDWILQNENRYYETRWCEVVPKTIWCWHDVEQMYDDRENNK